MIPILRAVALVAFAVVLLATDRASAQTAKVASESYLIPARDPGLQLFVRNKRPEGTTQFTSDKVLLFVHGATYPSETSFDLALDGLSWMDYIAQRGWDVYLMDVRGYGRSTRPEAMVQAAEVNPPIVNTDVAVRDVGAVVDHILARRGIAKVNLLGWSWGTAIMAAYTAQNNDKVERLALYAPLWLLKDAPPIGGLGAYRTVARDSAMQRWLRGVAPDKQKDLIPGGWAEAWWTANMAADPVGANQTPPVVRAPNGIIEDLKKYWMTGTPHYDPAQIRVPTLLIHADWDADTPAYMSQALFPKLTSAPSKRYVVIGEGTHTVIMEKNRMQLFREVQLFLDEPQR